MSAVITSVLAGVVALLLIVTAPSLFRQLRRGWTLHSTFLAALYLAPIFAILMAAVTKSKFQSTDELGAPVLISLENRGLEEASLLIAMGLGVVILARALLRGRALSLAPAALCLAATVLTYFSNLLRFDAVVDLPLLGMLAVYLGTAVGAEPRAVGRGVTAGVWFLVLVSSVVGVVFPSISSLPCSLGKCGPTGELFIGALNDENQLSITIAMGLPFVLLTLHGLARSSLVIASTALVVLSGSRSSLIAVGILLVLWIIVRKGRVTARRGLGIGVALGALGALILPLVVHDADAFTGRGGLWKIALSMVGSSPWIGLGQDAWAAQAAVGNVGSNASYSPHNVWLDALVAGGWISTLLILSALAVQLYRNGTASTWILFPLSMAVLEGFTERSFAYYDLASTTAFFLPALIAMGRPDATGSAPLRIAGSTIEAVLERRAVTAAAG